MSGQHTPGPWVAAPYEGFGPRTTIRQGCERTGMRIASTFETTSPRNIDRNEANARLIAAAPDLLDALQRCVAAWDRLYPKMPEDIEYEDCEFREMQDARAAIAKVTGSAS